MYWVVLYCWSSWYCIHPFYFMIPDFVWKDCCAIIKKKMYWYKLSKNIKVYVERKTEFSFLTNSLSACTSIFEIKHRIKHKIPLEWNGFWKNLLLRIFAYHYDAKAECMHDAYKCVRHHQSPTRPGSERTQRHQHSCKRYRIVLQSPVFQDPFDLLRGLAPIKSCQSNALLIFYYKMWDLWNSLTDIWYVLGISCVYV